MSEDDEPQNPTFSGGLPVSELYECHDRQSLRTDSGCEGQEEDEEGEEEADGEEQKDEQDSSSFPSEDDDNSLANKDEVSSSAWSSPGFSVTTCKRKRWVICKKGDRPRSAIDREIWGFLENDLALVDYHFRREQTSGKRYWGCLNEKDVSGYFISAYICFVLINFLFLISTIQPNKVLRSLPSLSVQCATKANFRTK